jgi:hypothetical protein
MSILTEQRAPATVKRIRRYFPDVDRVVDATKPLEVEVKKCDVSAAKMKKEDCCAMAKACERQNGVDGAIIKTTCAFVIKGNTAIKYHVPSCVTREIISFDRHGDFRPGSYYLGPVPKSHKTGGKRGAGNHTKPRGLSQHRRPYVYTQGIRSTPKGHDGE